MISTLKTAWRTEHPKGCSLRKGSGYDSSGSVCLASQLYSIDHSDQLLTGMRDRDVIMLSFCAFFSKICFECRVPLADIYGCIKQGIAQVSRASFLHVSIGDYSGPLTHPGRSSAHAGRVSAHLTWSALQLMPAVDQHTCQLSSFLDFSFVSITSGALLQI